MKTAYAIVITVITAVSAWSWAMPKQALSHWVWMPKMPQFIDDLDDPWIKENKEWLEQRPNPLADLCDLDSPLRHGGEDGRVYPSELFKYLEVDNNRAGIQRSGWENAVQRLQEIKSCPAALNDVQHLHVDIYLSSGSYGSAAEPVDPGKEILPLFVDVLSSMPNLRRLDWGLPPESTPYFGNYFTDQNLTLPSITHLVVGAFGDYLVPMCPNLTELQAGIYGDHWSWNEYFDREGPNPHKRLLQAASRVESIDTLSFSNGHDGWTSQVVQDVREAMPNIVHLKMGGNIQPGWRQTGRRPEPGEQLKEVLGQLKEFPVLERLQLPPASELELGFDGGHWCGNAYMGKEGRKYGRQVSRQRVETTELAGTITLEYLPHLKSLAIGDTPAVVTIDDDGKRALHWAWTGRLEDWLYEEWPEPSRFWGLSVQKLLPAVERPRMDWTLQRVQAG